jgi:hypothetical protein
LLELGALERIELVADENGDGHDGGSCGYYRHCERSEAIHSLSKSADGLLRRCAPLRKRFAFVAGNDDRGNNTRLPYRDASAIIEL